MMKNLYKEMVLDHFRRPRNKGELEGADVEQRVFNPLCGDEVTVYANLRDGGLAEVAFTGGAPCPRRRPPCSRRSCKARIVRKPKRR
jgi:NifU-like protein involved in Fe-S cluster formation